MARSKLRWNPDFFEQLGRSSGLYRVVESSAQRIANVARATAEVKTGEYRASIHVEEAPRRGRRVALVVADAPSAVGVESRTGNLARAAQNVRG